MCSFFSRLSHSPILRRAAVALLALVWISVAFSCHRSEEGSGEFQDAAGKGDLEKVQVLLKHNPDLVFSQDNTGNTPLHWAAAKGHKDLAQFLLANRADVNARNDSGRTPLQLAASNGHPGVVQLLRQRGGHD
jgi:ankyrin repeat protein